MRRYIRQITLAEVGEHGQRKLSNSRVLIVGAGGLGSPAALYLAAAGVGMIGIVDSDEVDLTNLNRQILHGTKSIGTSKVVSAAERISDLNPDVEVKTYKERLDDENASKIFKGYDIVLDGSDNFETRYIANDACVKLKIPFVHGSVLRFQGQVGVFAPSLGGPCYSCVYPEPPPREIAPTCVEAGVLGVIPGIVGTMQVLETLKLLLDFGEPSPGKLLIFDGLVCKMKALEVKKDLGCRVCR